MTFGFRILPWLALLASSSAFAHSNHFLRAVRAKAPPQIDGQVEEWGAAVALRLSSFHIAEKSKRLPETDADASYTLYSLWDETFLYLAVVVQDDVVTCPNVGKRLYANDCIEIAIDARNDTDSSYQADDFQFVFTPTGPTDQPQKFIFRNPLHHHTRPEDVQLAARLTPNGYRLEIAIPWRLLGLDPPRPGTVIGFQTSLRDYDDPKKTEAEKETPVVLCWSPSPDPTKNPLRWGDLILADTPDEPLDAIEQQLRERNQRYLELLRGRAEELDNDVTVRLRPEIVGRLEHGIGWNLQFRDGLVRDWTEAEWAAFFRLLKWTRPQWIRYGLNVAQWEPQNDNADPAVTNWAAFAVDSPIMQQHFRMFDFFEKEQIPVLLANWSIADRRSKADWLAETVHTPDTAELDDHPYDDAPYDPDEFIESITTLLHHLKNVKQYTCLRQVSLWNEPDVFAHYDSPSADYPDLIRDYYWRLHRRLIRMGLREKLAIAGPETTVWSYAFPYDWFRPRDDRDRLVFDLIAYHDYEGYLDYKRIDFGTPITEGLQYAPRVRTWRRFERDRDGTLRPGRLPVAITEFGNTGQGPYEVTGDENIFEGSLALAELIIRHLQQGVTGFLRWEFKDYGKGHPNFGALTNTDPRFLFKPFAPVFYPHAILSRYTRRGWRVHRTVVTGGRDAMGIPRLWATALAAPAGELTILVVNDGFEEKQLTFRLLGDQTGVLHHLSYDASLLPTLRRHPDVVPTGFLASVPVGPRSIHAFTTLSEGTSQEELDLPAADFPRGPEPLYEQAEWQGRPARRAGFGFERRSRWSVWSSNDEAEPTFQPSAEQAHLGKQSGRLDYEFLEKAPLEPADNGRERLSISTDLHLPGRPLAVGLWVYGDGQGHTLRLHFSEEQRQDVANFFQLGSRESFECPRPVTIDWVGWKQVHFDLAGFPEQWNHWQGDGQVQFPFERLGLILQEVNADFVGKGTLYLDDLEIICESAPPAPGAE